MRIDMGQLHRESQPMTDTTAYRQAVADGKLDAVEAWLIENGYEDRGTVDRDKLRRLCLLFVNRYDRRGVHLVGNPGTGKTMLARLLAERRDRQTGHRRHKWRVCPDIVAAYDPDAPLVTLGIGRQWGDRLEVYDELGNESKAKYGTEIMPTIIQNRFTQWERHGFRTIWISNHDPEKGDMEHYGSHVIDRLRGMSMTLRFKGESQR